MNKNKSKKIFYSVGVMLVVVCMLSVRLISQYDRVFDDGQVIETAATEDSINDGAIAVDIPESQPDQEESSQSFQADFPPTGIEFNLANIIGIFMLVSCLAIYYKSFDLSVR